jgi:hypothetical protein
MRSEYTQQSSGIYKDASPEKNIRADAVKEIFMASGVALTKSGRYVDLKHVEHLAPTPRV